MSCIGESIASHITELLAVVVVIIGAIWLWVRHNFAYWKRHNVPSVEANPIFGNFKSMFTWDMDVCQVFKRLYDHENAKDQPVLGVYAFNKPCLLVRDLELVKTILIKDFGKFSNRFSASDPHSDPLGADNLFFVKNPNWKEIRTKLSPVFTSGKIKQMFPLVEEIGNELDRYLCALPVDSKTNSTVQEVKEILALYSTDVIATVAYGIRANSLRNPNGDFRTHGRNIFHFTRMRAFEFTSMFFLPSIVRLLRLKVFSPESTKFLRNTLNYVIDERIKSGVLRNDLIDTLVKFRLEADEETTARDSGKERFTLKGDSIVAQAAIFFTAGYETTSTTMSFGLYELARRQDLQQRLRDEIRETLAKNDGKLTYESVNEMPYLNNVLREVLRHYPPLPFLDRELTLKAGETGYSLKPHLDYTMPHGMPVYIPIHSLHMDPKHFANPETFDPDRFAPENKHLNNLNAWLPFGTGPHNCIGERFGMLQAKIGLVNFLRNHYVTPCEKSHVHMKLDPRAIIIQSEGGVHCNVVRDIMA